MGGQEYYSSKRTRHQMPNGLVEEQHQERDATASRESMRLSRNIGDKGRTVMKTRRGAGPVESVETLQNISKEEAAAFDDTWQAHARGLTSPWSNSGSEGDRRRTPLISSPPRTASRQN
jgi:hypothetical protein